MAFLILDAAKRKRVVVVVGFVGSDDSIVIQGNGEVVWKSWEG